MYLPNIGGEEAFFFERFQSVTERNRSVKRGSALIVPYFSVIELAGGFEYFVTGAGEKIAVGRW